MKKQPTIYAIKNKTISDIKYIKRCLTLTKKSWEKWRKSCDEGKTIFFETRDKEFADKIIGYKKDVYAKTEKLKIIIEIINETEAKKCQEH